MSSLYILYVKHLISDSRTKSLYVHIVDLIHVPHLDKNNPMRTISCYAYLSGYLSISLKNNGTIEDASHRRKSISGPKKNSTISTFKYFDFSQFNIHRNTSLL
jgi:hypothetical protein